MKDNSVVGFLLCKLYKKRIKELEDTNKFLVSFIKEKLPEYRDWTDINFGGAENGTERDN